MQSPPHPLLLVMKYPLPCPSHPPLQNTLAFLPWIISHHHIRPVVLISGESSPKLLFLCQSEACYQATVWPNSLKPTPHPPKPQTNTHTHGQTHMFNYSLDSMPKMQLERTFSSSNVRLETVTVTLNQDGRKNKMFFFSCHWYSIHLQLLILKYPAWNTFTFDVCWNPTPTTWADVMGPKHSNVFSVSLFD